MVRPCIPPDAGLYLFGLKDVLACKASPHFALTSPHSYPAMRGTGPPVPRLLRDGIFAKPKELETLMGAPILDLNQSNIRPAKVMSHGSAPDAQALRQRVKDWCRSWPEGNRGGVFTRRASLAADSGIQLLSDFGKDVAISNSLTEYKALWRPILNDTFRNWDFRIVTPIDLRQTEEMAAVTFFASLNGTTHDDQEMSQLNAVSQIWQKISGDWQLVHEHTSVHSEGR